MSTVVDALRTRAHFPVSCTQPWFRSGSQLPCVAAGALRCDESLAHLVRVVVLVSSLPGLCHGPCVVAGALRCDESLAHLARAVVLVSCLSGLYHGSFVVARALRCDGSLTHLVRVVVLVSCLSGLCHGPCAVASALRCDESLAHLTCVRSCFGILFARPLPWTMCRRTRTEDFCTFPCYLRAKLVSFFQDHVHCRTRTAV